MVTCDICGVPVVPMGGALVHQYPNGTAYTVAYDADDIHPATVQGPS